MDYTCRKSYLKFKIINESIYLSEVVRLMEDKALKQIICSIDEESFYDDVEKKDKLSVKRFIELLNNYVEIFRGIFVNMRNYTFELKSSISYCDNLIEKYFSNKTNDNNQDDYVYKIIFYNFLDNAKYVPHITTLLRENDISIKNVMNYNHEECLKIIQLMSDLVFCRGNVPITYLFTNITEHLEMLKENSKNKENLIQDEEKYLNSVNRDYEIIIQDYESKKQYLKYFLNKF